MKRRAKTLLLFLATVGLLSCQKELAHDQEVKDVDHVTMFARDFALGQLGPQTKTALTINGNVAEFSWKSTDIVGVYPDEGTQVRFPILSGHIEDGTSTSEANFTGCGWAVKKQHDYMAYYPFVPDMDMDKTAIPVTFAGQVQKGNVNTDHIEHFDYMAAALQSPTKTGEIAFHFEHLGCLFEFVVKAPKAAEYTSVSLVSNGQFVIDGKYDLTAEVPAIEAVSTSNELVLSLEDVQTTEPNEELKLYMMMAPVDLSGQDIIVKLKGPHAEFEVNLGPGTNFKAGKFYRPSLSGIQGGDIIMLEDGSSFCHDIKTLANGEDFPADKNDYMIRHIKFETSNSEVPEGIAGKDYVDVSAPDSSEPIYAIWDKVTGTITIRTSGLYCYCNPASTAMFLLLRSLETIDFTGFNFSKATDFSFIFMGCASLESIDFLNQDIPSVWNMLEAFEDCTKLRSITGLKPKGYVGIRDLCHNCSSLESFDLSDWHILESEYAFSGCVALESIDLTGIDTSHADDFEQMFINCRSLKTLDLSSFTFDSAKWISSLFEGCSSLESIILSDNFGGYETKDFKCLFQGCTNLKNIDLSKLQLENKESFYGMFAGCESLETVDVTGWVRTSVTNIARMFEGCKSLKTLDLSSWNTSAVNNMGGLFQGCSALKSIDLSGFNTVQVTDMNRMFCGTGLTTLNLSSFNTSKVTNMERMFSQSSSLVGIIGLDKFVTSEVTSMEGMFHECSSLSSIDLTSFDTSNVTRMENMFWRCSNLETIDITMFNTSKVGNFEGMFGYCEKLREIKGIGDLDTHFADNLSIMFEGCKCLEGSLDLSKWNTNQMSSCYGMFVDCEKLQSIDISGFNTENVSSAPGRMFRGCNSLETLKLGVNFMQPLAFNDCHQNNISVYTTRAFMNSLKERFYDFWRNNNFYDFQTNVLMKAAGSDVEL